MRARSRNEGNYIPGEPVTRICSAPDCYRETTDLKPFCDAPDHVKLNDYAARLVRELRQRGDEAARAAKHGVATTRKGVSIARSWYARDILRALQTGVDCEGPTVGQNLGALIAHTQLSMRLLEKYLTALIDCGYARVGRPRVRNKMYVITDDGLEFLADLELDDVMRDL